MARSHAWGAHAKVCVAVGFVVMGGCGADMSGGGFGPADPGLPTSPPTSPAPTGSKWKGVEVTGDCGRSTLAWVLVDEMCADTDDPGYLDALRSPMFRDGTLIDDTLYVVDATRLWVLDVAQTEPKRLGVLGGLGHPVAIANHGGRLVIASGEAGLLMLEPKLPGVPVPFAELPLPGPALDVFIEGDRAVVAMGKAGLAVIDLAPTLAVPPASPKLLNVVPSPGFAVGVATRTSYAFVAACDTFAVVHLQTGELVGQSWLKAYDASEILTAPARDIALVDDRAFVAAGRHGVVEVDVAKPATPQLLGECTEPYDQSFYVSGVRAEGQRLFAAAGEWGVRALDVAKPPTCAVWLSPQMPPTPSGDEACNPKPPWQVLPWHDLWTPPPPSKDPVQTLPAGDVLYAFGDARRIGTRAVDVRDVENGLQQVGRYDEPRLVVALAAGGGRVLAVGEGGGLFAADSSGLLSPLAAPEKVEQGVSAVVLADGRWAFSTESELRIESAAPKTFATPLFAHGPSARDSDVVIALAQGVAFVDPAGVETLVPAPRPAALPPAVVAKADGVFLAAPEWERALRIDASGKAADLPPNGVFGAAEISDANLWREGLPRRLLADSAHGVVEIASLGARAGLTLHTGAADAPKLALPAGTYVDAVAHGDTLYVVTADRGVYQSALLTVSLSKTSAVLLHTESFTGVATSIAADGARLYVGDADRGIRVYSTAEQPPTLLGVYALGGAP
ncbi:MAG: hypothetical protein U0263_08500 [Polyangiaceae bacterium]